jgi:hypothetical protein
MCFFFFSSFIKFRAVPSGLASVSYLPGTSVPDFHIPPLRG